MSQQRFYSYATVFNIPIYNMRNLWEPSTEYQGKPVQKPNYLAGFLVPRTMQEWHQEPAFADVVRAATELCGKYGIPVTALEWPFRDGNIPEPGKAPIEYMKNHWVFTGSSAQPIGVNMVQNGAPQPLINRATVKPGDLCVVSLSLAISQQNSRKAKIYCNSVLFVGPGEEIAVGNSVTGAQLMELAKQQGLNITGFQPAGATFGGAPQGGGFGGPAPMQPQGGGFGGPAPIGNGGPGGFGAPQPQAGGYSAPAPAQGGFVAPNVQGQPSAGYGSPQPQGFGAPQPQGDPNAGQGGFTAPQPMQPQAAGGGFGQPQPGQAGAPSFVAPQPQGFGAPAQGGGGFAAPQNFGAPQPGGFAGPR